MREYKSPVRKLIVFFEKSRDTWKEKCQEAKYNAKKLKNQVHYLKARKRELKEEVRLLETQLTQLRVREQRLSAELEAVKKSLNKEAFPR